MSDALLPSPALAQEFYEALQESQYWSPEKLLEHQRQRISLLVEHARENVPFYGDRLNVLMADSGRIDWHRWHDVPTVTRRQMANDRESMQAVRLPPGSGHSQTARTSGSSGISIVVTVNALSLMADKATRWRGQHRCGLNWSFNLCSRQIIEPTSGVWPEGKRLGRWGPSWRHDTTGVAWGLYKGTPAEQTFEFAGRMNCPYINGGAKTLHAMALEAERLGIEVKLQAILAQGENCDDDDREACRRVFGATIIEHYSAKEGGQMAHPCELGTLHVNSETVFLEVVDDAGAPCPEGVAGRVVVTPLYLMSQPLIRYEQGDIAVLGGPCPCGRSSPTLAKIVGRTVTIFRHPDGRAVSRLMPHTARLSLDCEMWQIAQIGPTEFEVRYVPRNWGTLGDEQAFVDSFREVYFEDASVRFVRTKHIQPAPSGKIIEYTNEQI
jgi:phenylacetate-CoA ligase